jgi:hypothetical protein
LLLGGPCAFDEAAMFKELSSDYGIQRYILYPQRRIVQVCKRTAFRASLIDGMTKGRF